MTDIQTKTQHPLWKRVAATAFVVLAGYGAGNILAKIAIFGWNAA
jgi:hypothetical protein|tara:strand:- start:6083 stop:6217 length:135 start_codon:yes stop_codon:yes gene_type:complete